MARKNARFLAKRFNELWHEDESLWNILSDHYKIRQEKEKKCGSMSEKLEMTVINHFFKIFFESSFCELEVRRSHRHIQNPFKHLR